MLEIKLIGKEQTGKTIHAYGLAENYAFHGKRVLFVSPTVKAASHHERSTEGRLKGVRFIGCQQFNKTLCGSHWDLIIFDELEQFAPNQEGSYVELAKSRLRINPFATLAYTMPEDKRQWISTSIWWKPWTYGTGYWSN